MPHRSEAVPRPHQHHLVTADAQALLTALDKAARESPSPGRGSPWQPPRRVLFVTPDSFRIEAAINVHMADEHGRPRTVDPRVARAQWQSLVDIYGPIVGSVACAQWATDLPDIVFCANQTLPFLRDDGTKAVLISEMRNDSRKPEVPFFESFFREQGYDIIKQNTASPEPLEGMGDVLLVPPEGNRPAFYCAGFGPRTSRRALDWVAAQTGKVVCALELPNPKFYHLDTCLSVFDSRTALACRDGFTDQGWQVLQTIFPRLIPCPLAEADAPGFACNSHSPDGRHVIIQKGSPRTVEALRSHGFEVIEVDTSEFIKAGGSVFCMKMMFW